MNIIGADLKRLPRICTETGPMKEAAGSAGTSLLILRRMIPAAKHIKMISTAVSFAVTA